MIEIYCLFNSKKHYNAALRKLGDENPSFIDAVTDLTASRCRQISAVVDNYDFRAAGMYTQSVGSCMKRAASGAFPLNMSYHLVGHFDGPNDGLVGEPSFRWGENYTFLQNKKNRGISHGDMIDLNRENINGFEHEIESAGKNFFDSMIREKSIFGIYQCAVKQVTIGFFK